MKRLTTFVIGIASLCLLSSTGCFSGPSGPPIETRSDFRRIAVLPVAPIDMREGRLDGPVITAQSFETEARSRLEADRAVKYLCRKDASIDSPQELESHLKRIGLHEDLAAYQNNGDPERDRVLLARIRHAAAEAGYDGLVRMTTAVSLNVGEVRATIGPWVYGETEVQAALFGVTDDAPVRVARGRGTYEFADGILYLFPFATGTRPSHAMTDAMRNALDEVLPGRGSAETASDTAQADVLPAAPH
jgi:hypothetical protein